MASIFKPKGSDRYVILYWDENHNRRKKIGTRDKSVTQRIANDLENKVALRKAGLINPKDEARAKYATESLDKHIAAWKASILAKNACQKHVEAASHRALIVVALVKGARLDEVNAPQSARRHGSERYDAALAKVVGTARLSDLTAEKVQEALATLKAKGRSFQTCNHYRAAITTFARWCRKTGRLQEDILFGVDGYNAKEDPRHDRRTESLENVKRFIAAAESGKEVMGVTGPVRALVYRLAIESGLRYSEIGSIKPESFDWKAPSVTVDAAYTKNGQTAALPLTDDLAGDLAAYVAGFKPGETVFLLPFDQGARMLRHDLKAAGIPYRDDAGRVFDFHALRCQLATNADAAGVSPRVVQRLMRHSSLELTGRYTRPRAVDIEAAVDSLPSLKPESTEREALAATGTDDATAQTDLLPASATWDNVDERNILSMNDLRENPGSVVDS
jgi:integrase